ncbi:heterodisulfide reductase [candidate division KSB1 bacterium RBG_16_48_16]|nr:MAG: heterodisulfide reductase [candidate division KSB1 bacterium RBG_16_48_16]
MHVKRVVKYEAELDRDFADWIMSVPGGEKIRDCIQCGACSGSCPLSVYMDHTPRRLINLARAGFKDEVLNSFTIWLCASCYSCTDSCPMNIKMTDLMYILKRKAIEEKVYPKKFPIPVLSKEFFKMVGREGRSTETRLLVNLILKTNPLKFFGLAPLGLKLLKTGRIGLKKESIKAKKELSTILGALKEETA